MKLNFEPAATKVGDYYLITPKNDSEHRCVMKCNDVGAFIVNLLYPQNRNRDEMIALTMAQYPNATLEEIEACVDGVRTALKNTE